MSALFLVRRFALVRSSFATCARNASLLTFGGAAGAVCLATRPGFLTWCIDVRCFPAGCLTALTAVPRSFVCRGPFVVLVVVAVRRPLVVARAMFLPLV